MENLEKLKAFCEKEGFDFDLHAKSGVVLVSEKKQPKKDIWEGVYFGLFNGRSAKYFTKGKIYFFNKDYSSTFCDFGNYQGISKSWVKDNFVPSTESAYVEQLKKEAFERFGEIKEGDRFIEPSEQIDYPILDVSILKWDYVKDSDLLFFYNLMIYDKGKWAERVKERVKINLKSSEIYHTTLLPKLEFEFNSSIKVEKSKSNELGQFLASCLEKYLNGEILDAS